VTGQAFDCSSNLQVMSARFTARVDSKRKFTYPDALLIVCEQCRNQSSWAYRLLILVTSNLGCLLNIGRLIHVVKYSVQKKEDVIIEVWGKDRMQTK
jgi:hypothetical protein